MRFNKYVLAGLVAGLTVLVTAGIATAGYAPANRATFQCITPTNCPGASYVTFNSSTNAPNYGDERAFFDAKDATNTNSGGFTDQMTVQDGQKVLMRVYVHNNANPNAIGEAAATARNTRIMALLETNSKTTHVASAQVTADNANPGTVSDTVDLVGANPFTMVFDRSAPINVTYRPNGTGDWVTRPLPGATFTNDQTITANVGDWKGCFEYSALITFTAIVRMPTVPPPAAAKCDNLTVTPGTGRRIDASVAYTTTGGATLKTVTFDWGDGSTPLVTSNTNASYTYNRDDTFNIRATLTFNVGGVDQTSVCTKQVTFTTTPPTTTVTPPTTVTQPGKGVEVVSQLPNTGAGSVAAIFAGVSALAGGVHYMWNRRFSA